QDIIIGTAFLCEHNPELNWNAGNIEFTCCPSTCTWHTVTSPAGSVLCWSRCCSAVNFNRTKSCFVPYMVCAARYPR
ncbi:hypothetical protein BD311DRAFT_676995, partial [Dichomitus squalens]